jgi:hypothetical protein
MSCTDPCTPLLIVSEAALFANWPVRPLLENAHARKRAQNAIEDVGVRVRVSREIGGRQRAGCQPVGKLQLRCRVERCRRNVSGGNLKTCCDAA